MTDSPPSAPDAQTVFVVHGRNEALRRSMFDFLRAIGLRPLEWSTAIAMTGNGSPYIGDVLDAAFAQATAVVVLLTPDEFAYLREDLAYVGEADTKPALQARPNVLFEAGMAIGSHAANTVMVEIGQMRSFSDLAGRHVIRLTNDVASRQEVANRLRTAGCAVELTGTDWHTAGDFTAPAPPQAHATPAAAPEEPATREAREELTFGVTLDALDRGRGRLKVKNEGDQDFTEIALKVPAESALTFQANQGPRAVRIPRVPSKRSVTLLFSRDTSKKAVEATAFTMAVEALRADGEKVEGNIFIDLNEHGY